MSKLQVNELEHPSSGSLLTLRKPARPDDAAAPNELIRLSQLQSYAAPAAGSASQPFAVAPPVTADQAIPLGHLGTVGATLFAALQGSAAQVFSVAAATADTHAVRRVDTNTRAGYSYSENDWCWLDKSRGLRLQYGRITIVGNNATWMSGVVSFPIAFTQACFGVIGSGTNRAGSDSLNATGGHILTAFGEYFDAAPATFRWRIDSNDSISIAGTKVIVWAAIGI